MDFPFGKAPLCILILALVSGAAVHCTHSRLNSERADLVFALFAKNHHDAYLGAVADFEQRRHVTVQMQLVHSRALQSRLQSAMLVGAETPDVVEILNGSMGFFTTGPLEDVGFVDLTGILREEGLDRRLVESRFSLWSSRGHIFALPHDVHPVALAYRRDLVEALGIDVEALHTWDDFAREGRRITADTNRDGVLDRYMIDLPANGTQGLQTLILQSGGAFFDEQGEVAFDSPIVADVVCWYIEQIFGPRPIATSAGGGQALAQAALDGLTLFFLCPDWRTKSFEIDIPSLKGKMGLMPLPAWTAGGRRTSTWGGTGMVIAKSCQNFDLAWDFAKFLYFDKEELGKRFALLNIIPPLKDAWDLPEFQQPSEYFAGQPIGELLSALAPDTPADYVTAYTLLARQKVDEAYANSVQHYQRHGGRGLRECVERELRRSADYVRRVVMRNRFLHPEPQGD